MIKKYYNTTGEKDVRIVIVGIGKVGYILTDQLCHEGHSLVIVDKNTEVLKNAQNKLDVATVAGNGASVEIQQEANVSEADLLIAVTSSDEVNILCSMVAHKLGCRSIISRVRNPEYDRQMSFLNEDMGITFTFNPEKSAANEIFRILQFSSFLKCDPFAGGRADMVEFRIPADSPLADKKLCEIDSLSKCKAIVCAAERDGDVIIPSGNFVLSAQDYITLAAPPKYLPQIAKVFGMPKVRIKQVMVIGGSTIAAYLAAILVENHVDVTLIETDQKRCRELAEMLPDITVICGNGTEQSLLMDEGIKDMDAVVSLTGVDEENFLISMFAHFVGVPKTVTKNNRIEYSDIFRDIGIDSIISPKYLIANQIVRYVRAASASTEGSIETLYRILDDRAEALGFTVPDNADFLDIPLESLHFRKNTLIALILRNQNVIIPGGTSCLMAGDSIIAVTKKEYAISGIGDLFTKSEGSAK